MNTTEFLRAVCAQDGLPGNEGNVGKYLQEAFAPYCKHTRMDTLQNVIAHMPGSGKGPKVLVTAHMDEIGLVVTGIEEDGCLRFGQMGGVDSRILPGSEVKVLCDPPLFGVVGAKPPHLLSAEDRKKNYRREDLHIDIGYSQKEAKRRVMIGDRIQLVGPLTQLENDRLAGKTMDDRACVAVMWLVAQQMHKQQLDADIYFVCATQEEVGSRGAQTACYDIDPDIAIAMDVTHGQMPDTKPDETYALDKVVMSCGPNIHPKLHAQILELAKKNKVEVQVSPCPYTTWTDADVLQVSRAGVPTVLIELPLKYMHTTVETLSMHTLEEVARLLVAYLGQLDQGWEEALCY